MEEKMLNETICLKQYITKKDYEEIKQLKNICYSNEKKNLKLELDYKLNVIRSSQIGLKEINEFLYYIDDVLVAYLGISSFGGSNIAEINGMTHPDFRRKGLFKKLLNLAVEECKKKKFSQVLLLSDGKSESGVKFINSVLGEYSFSEYRMKSVKKTMLDGINIVKLRKATNKDGKEMGRQDAIFFNLSEECECFPEREEKLNKFTYMIELDGMVIGKIKVRYRDNSAFISGFGILPEYRGKGYGKSALKATMHLINEKSINEIELDVACKNNTALNLYKSCGFKEQSVMNYYEYKIN